MDQSPPLSEIALKLYADILRDIALEDPSLTDLIDEMTLGALMTNPESMYANGSTLSQQAHLIEREEPEESAAQAQDIFSDDELLMFGSPVRRHLSISLRKRVSEEVRRILVSIARCYPRGQEHEELAEDDEDAVLEELPDRTQRLMDDIKDKNQMFSEASRRIAELVSQIEEVQADFDQHLRHALSVTLPVHDATRTASIELLATAIEHSLVKLSLARARAERIIYNHTNQTVPSRDKNKKSGTVGKALENAYMSLKKDESEMDTEIQALNCQLLEYESLMQLVDNGNGGYREVVDDWTKVKQETDECLKDLRRLGWMGD